MKMNNNTYSEKNTGRVTEVLGCLDIDISRYSFILTCSGDSVILRKKESSPYKNYFDISQFVGPLNSSSLQFLHKLLLDNGITVYLHNRFFPILGRKSNAILRSLLSSSIKH
jgi:hypothetical protein